MAELHNIEICEARVYLAQYCMLATWHPSACQWQGIVKQLYVASHDGMVLHQNASVGREDPETFNWDHNLIRTFAVLDNKMHSAGLSCRASTSQHITFHNSVTGSLAVQLPGFTEYYRTWLRHWRLDNSIIQRGVTSDNWSRPLAFFPKVVCRVSSRQGATIDVFKSEIENQKYFTVIAEIHDLG